MANTVNSMVPLGNTWVATVTMDTAAATAVIPTGTVVGVEKIVVGPGSATGVGLITVENAAGDELLRVWATTVAVPTTAGKEVRSDGLTVRAATVTLTTVVTIHFRYISGTAVVAV